MMEVSTRLVDVTSAFEGAPPVTLPILFLASRYARNSVLTKLS
jgi:hypothetical protein